MYALVFTKSNKPTIIMSLSYLQFIGSCKKSIVNDTIFAHSVLFSYC